MFKKLLVPLDRSPLAEQAIGQAAAIARASQAEIDLALVHQPFPFNGYSDAPWNVEAWSEEQQYLATIAAELTSGSSVPVTYAALKGEPVEMLCQHIKDVQADLVVMTSHGRTGLSRSWLGSIADGVLHHATVPVLILRPIEGKARQLAAHHLFKHILVPVDGSALAAEVLPRAASLAKCSNARVSLLRVVQPPPMISPEAGIPFTYVAELADDSMTKNLKEEAREQLSDVARRFHDESGVEVEAHVVVDRRVGPAILAFAGAHGIDSIAMSTHGRGVSRFLVGSVADKVLRGSDVPMLLYRPIDIRTKSETAQPATESQAPTLTHA